MTQEYEYNGKAMGTDFSIALVCDSKEHADTCAQNAQEKIHAYEKRFSRFLPDSELSLLNTQKKRFVSDIFLHVTTEAYKLFTQTKGIFNPLLQIERFGYNRNFDDLVEDSLKETNEPYNIDFSTTHINPDTKEIILAEGQKLDFGGFLKGYLAELLCTEMSASPSVTGVIVNIGGDLCTRGFDSNGAPFVFDVYNPVTKENISIPLSNMSLATSGTYKRTWKHSQVNMHHILNASGTQNPDTDIVSASILHKSGSTAEAYAKVFLSLGSKQAQDILLDAESTFILITHKGDVLTNIL